MYRITWTYRDKYVEHFAIVASVEDLHAIYWALTGYGREDGCVPTNIKCWDLEGNLLDRNGRTMPNVTNTELSYVYPFRENGQ